jgi:hypothetical protein
MKEGMYKEQGDVCAGTIKQEERKEDNGMVKTNTKIGCTKMTQRTENKGKSRGNGERGMSVISCRIKSRM